MLTTPSTRHRNILICIGSVGSRTGNSDHASCKRTKYTSRLDQSNIMKLIHFQKMKPLAHVRHMYGKVGQKRSLKDMQSCEIRTIKKRAPSKLANNRANYKIRYKTTKSKLRGVKYVPQDISANKTLKSRRYL